MKLFLAVLLVPNQIPPLLLPLELKLLLLFLPLALDIPELFHHLLKLPLLAALESVPELNLPALHLLQVLRVEPADFDITGHRMNAQFLPATIQQALSPNCALRKGLFAVPAHGE